MCYVDVDFHSWINLYHRHLETITDYKVLYWVLPSKCIWVKVTKFESSVASHPHKFHFPLYFFGMQLSSSNMTNSPCPVGCVTTPRRVFLNHNFKSPRLRGTHSLALLASTFSTQPQGAVQTSFLPALVPVALLRSFPNSHSPEN